MGIEGGGTGAVCGLQECVLEQGVCRGGGREGKVGGWTWEGANWESAAGTGGGILMCEDVERMEGQEEMYRVPGASCELREGYLNIG